MDGRCFLLALLVATKLSCQEKDPCADPAERQAWNDRQNPVYADATELAGALEGRGFDVECIARSKEEAMFDGQKGAAWFKTDHGIFEVWFLPKTETFSALAVVERPGPNGAYSYTFQGTPRIPRTIQSPRQIWYIKSGNLLFEVWGDPLLAASLDSAFRKT